MAPQSRIFGSAVAILELASALPSKVRPSQNLVVGGEPAELGEFPFIVSLSGEFGHSCGGSLVNENTVLTAAHCVVDATAAGTKVRAGSLTASGGGIQVGVEELIPHPDFDMANLSSDVAIVKLSEPIEESDHIGYVELPSAGDGPAANTTLIAAGWGATTEAGTDPSDDLLKVEVPSVSREACAEKWREDGTEIGETQICAGHEAGEKDVCYGDSGGPLVDAETKVIVGTVSFGQPCAQPGWPTVYGNVANLLDFITNNS